MRKAQGPLVVRPRGRKRHTESCIHLFAPPKIAPGIIRQIVRIILVLGLPVRIRHPVTLRHPETGRSRPPPLCNKSNKNELRPGLHHGLALRNAPALLVQAGRVHHLVNQDSCGLLFPIDKDAVRGTGRGVAPIDMLGSEILPLIRKLPLLLRGEIGHTPGVSCRPEPVEDLRPEFPVRLSGPSRQKHDNPRQISQTLTDKFHSALLISFPDAELQPQPIKLSAARRLLFSRREFCRLSLARRPFSHPQPFCVA